MSSTSVLQECQVRSVTQQCQVGSVKQKCLTRVLRNSVKQRCLFSSSHACRHSGSWASSCFSHLWPLKNAFVFNHKPPARESAREWPSSCAMAVCCKLFKSVESPVVLPQGCQPSSLMVVSRSNHLDDKKGWVFNRGNFHEFSRATKMITCEIQSTKKGRFKGPANGFPPSGRAGYPVRINHQEQIEYTWPVPWSTRIFFFCQRFSSICRRFLSGWTSPQI